MGRVEGGTKTAATIKAYNPNHYRTIGKMGGSAKVAKGFAMMDKAKVSEAGRKGGEASRNTRVN